MKPPRCINLRRHHRYEGGERCVLCGKWRLQRDRRKEIARIAKRIAPVMNPERTVGDFGAVRIFK